LDERHRIHRELITPFVIAFLMVGALLPNMVLAWNLPEEAPEAAATPPDTP
jgi:hypothetical protein